MHLALVPEAYPGDAAYFEGVYAHDAGYNGALRTFPLRPQGDPMGAVNRLYLLEWSTITGYEGYDYQNPLAFAGGLLQTASQLDTRYGIVGDTRESIMRNIIAGQGLIRSGAL